MRDLQAMAVFALLVGGCAQTPSQATLPAAESATPQVRPFPEIADWQSLRIVYSRGGPPWVSPGYVFEIAGDGTVRYRGDANVATIGERSGSIEQDELRKLVQRFKATNFFNLENAYRARMTDQERVSLTISFDGLSKSVEDHAGLAVGMPVAVAELQQAVVSASGVSKWTGL